MDNGEEELLRFYKNFDSEDHYFDITTHSAEEVNFLDTIIRLKNNTIRTSLYKKSTHFQAYVHPVSFHPPHIFASKIFSQALRHKRICYDAKELTLQLITLKNAFIPLE